MCKSARAHAYYVANRKRVNAKHRANYAAHRQERMALVVARRVKAQTIMDAAKGDGCVDCGFLDKRALDFDHVRGRKLFAISQGRDCRLPTLLAEISKCEVRCANCHRIATVERRASRILREESAGA